MTLRTAVATILGIILGGIAISILAVSAAKPGTPPPPVLYTNEAFVENVRTAAVDLNNPHEVFAHVFTQLQPEVDVYPTENYYYFQFFTGAYDIRGNIRLDADTRDYGEINFAYFAAPNRQELPFVQALPTHHIVLTAADGVRLTPESPLIYLLTYRGKTVRFRLHNVPQTLPDALELREGEEFLFRIFDESGFQLVVVYDTAARGFRFLLDETAPLPDTLEPLAEKLLVGRRSGFAFFNDPDARRKVLVGVDSANHSLNNYYDGPFDQLADNFINGDTFRRYLEEAYPERAGKLTRRGEYIDENGRPLGIRLALQPYQVYDSLGQLLDKVQECEQQAQAVACLTRDAAQHE